MTDILAQGLAAQALTIAQAGSGARAGSVGIRLFGGRTYNPFSIATGATTGTTFEVMMTTALPFDAVRIIYAMGNTATTSAITPGVAGSVTVVGDTSDTTLSAASWAAITYGGTGNVNGSGTSTLPFGPAADRRSFTVSDIIPISSIARTDGGAYPLLVVRSYLYQTTGAVGNVVISGNGVQSFANWATHPSGRIWRMLNKGGNYASSGQTGMVSTNSSVGTGSPIAGIVYYARGKVVNVVGIGDSITEGQGTYIGEGFGFPATLALNAGQTGVAYEWSDLGWAGCTMSEMRQNLIDAVTGMMTASADGTSPGRSSLRWDVGVLPGFSPNDISTTITAAIISQQRLKAGHMLDLMRQANIASILWTGLPTNTSVKAYGSTDSLRRGLNADYRTWASHGSVIADFDNALAGVDDGSGQIQMASGTTTDGIHPNDVGNAKLVPILQRALAKLVAPVNGGLMQ